MNQRTPRPTRRALFGAAALLPQAAFGAARSANDKLNIAGVGVGSMGGGYLRNCESENIVALCDVDHDFAAKTFARYPKAARYHDFRKMLEAEKGIDAVVIGTPDHMHAAIALAAIQLGKHVYCAKPLTRTIAEARRLAGAARQAKVATQMSVQSCASEAACATAEWIRAGAVGTVREVHVWSDRPVWPQALTRPAETPAPPASLDWDLWLGSAPRRPYHPVYHPFNWRGWYDFGTGALGDMGCHAMHVIVRALELAAPLAVSASTSALYQLDTAVDPMTFPPRARRAKFDETFPAASMVTWEFPTRVVWYDGGLKPPRPAELDSEAAMPGSGILFIGDKGVLLSGFTGGPRLLPESRHQAYAPPPKTLERTAEHYQEWIAAAKGGKPAACEFGFASLLTEITLLGVIAQRTGKALRWDSTAMRFPNDPAAQPLVGG